MSEFNKSNHIKLLFFFLSCLLLLFFFNAIQANAYSGKTTLNYDGRPIDEETGEPKGPPLSISFTPKAGSYYNYYANRSDTPKNVFYEEFYFNRFHWYSMVPRVSPTAREAFMGYMYDNLQTALGGPKKQNNYKGGDFLVDAFSGLPYRYNIKKGSADPDTAVYQGDNTGTNLVSLGAYAGKNYEWRYMGYSIDGEVVPNPYFPADYYSPETDWRTMDWDILAWNTNKYKNFNGTVYDDDQKKAEWIRDYWLETRPQFRLTDDIDKDAEWWAKRLSLRTDPEISSGILYGWHILNGHAYYMTFVMDAPPRPNLRITEYKVTKKGASQENGIFTRSKTDNQDFTETIVYKKPDGIDGRYITKNETYILEAKVKNMEMEGLEPKDTTYTPIHLDILISMDDMAYKFNEYNFVRTGLDGCAPVDPTITSIKYGEEVDYRCEIKIPHQFKDKIEIGLRIPGGFYDLGENINNQDDVSILEFEPMPEDMILQSVQILDNAGNYADAITQGQTYGAMFTVKKNKGVIPVGDTSVLSNNPYATVNVYATDNGSIKVQDKVVADKILKLDDTAVLKIDKLITPNTSHLKVCGEISYIHDDAGLNIRNPLNLSGAGGVYSDNLDPFTQKQEGDDYKCHEIVSETNISVKDFIINPPSIKLPYGEYSTSETLTFNFKLTYRSDEKKPLAQPVLVELRQGNTLLEARPVMIPLNATIPQSWTIPNVNLKTGNNFFTVEVNPEPRAIFEWLKGNVDPYKDNIARNSVYVETNVMPNAVCSTPHKENTWVTTYSIYEWWGYLSCTTTEDGDKKCVCVTESISYTEDVSHYERYGIDKVMFKSKLTEDTQGGWVDIMKQPGKVKAGYGFEIKVVTKYKTNIETASPKPWRGTCSGRTVSPQPDTVNPNNKITITMPYTDKNGQPVRYNLTGSRSGIWYNQTQTYEMPMRNAFGLKNTRQIFVNEGAKDGTYQIRIDTLPFYGTYHKPKTDKELCDRVYVNIQIIGANSDDVNTHITQ